MKASTKNRVSYKMRFVMKMRLLYVVHSEASNTGMPPSLLRKPTVDWGGANICLNESFIAHET